MRLVYMNFLVSPTRRRSDLEWRGNEYIFVTSPKFDLNHDLLGSHNFNISDAQVDIVLSLVLHHVFDRVDCLVGNCLAQILEKGCHVTKIQKILLLTIAFTYLNFKLLEHSF